MGQKNYEGPGSHGHHHPEDVKKHWEGVAGIQCSWIGLVHHVRRKGSAGTLVTLGTYICVPPERVHGRVVVVDACDRLRAVALPAGNVDADGREAPGLTGVAFDAGDPILEPQTLM